jgi:hypothetical protein
LKPSSPAILRFVVNLKIKRIPLITISEMLEPSTALYNEGGFRKFGGAPLGLGISGILDGSITGGRGFIVFPVERRDLSQ